MEQTRGSRQDRRQPPVLTSTAPRPRYVNRMTVFRDARRQPPPQNVSHAAACGVPDNSQELRGRRGRRIAVVSARRPSLPTG